MVRRQDGAVAGCFDARGVSLPHLPLLIAGSVDLEIVLLGTRKSVLAHSRAVTLNVESHFYK